MCEDENEEKHFRIHPFFSDLYSLTIGQCIRSVFRIVPELDLFLIVARYIASRLFDFSRNFQSKNQSVNINSLQQNETKKLTQQSFHDEILIANLVVIHIFYSSNPLSKLSSLTSIQYKHQRNEPNQFLHSFVLAMHFSQYIPHRSASSRTNHRHRSASTNTCQTNRQRALQRQRCMLLAFRIAQTSVAQLSLDFDVH